MATVLILIIEATQLSLGEDCYQRVKEYDKHNETVEKPNYN